MVHETELWSGSGLYKLIIRLKIYGRPQDPTLAKCESIEWYQNFYVWFNNSISKLIFYRHGWPSGWPSLKWFNTYFHAFSFYNDNLLLLIIAKCDNINSLKIKIVICVWSKHVKILDIDTLTLYSHIFNLNSQLIYFE